MVIRLRGKVEKRDLLPYTYPPLSDLRKINYRSVCLGSYIPWDIKKQVSVIKKELGWKGDKVENVPENYDYEKIECYMQGVRDYIKYIKEAILDQRISLQLISETIDLKEMRPLK